MKKIIIIGLLLTPIVSFTQNLFPDNGNVGIGTNSPTANFDLNGSFKLNTNELNFSNSDISSYKILIQTSDGILKTTTVENMKFLFKEPVGIDHCTTSYFANPHWIGGANKLFIKCPDINVGIGTENPIHKLQVIGTSFSWNYLGGNPTASTNAIFNGFAPDNTQDLISLGVKLGTNSEEVKFKVTNDGIVFVKELRVRELQNFPDYVFSNTYNLMPLLELEKYIIVNKHLPNMPTADNVESEGANIGEIQRVLVEKVEELTLYNIELKKENNELLERLKDLENNLNDIKLLIENN